MVATAATHTQELVAGRHILAIQDTTTLRYEGTNAASICIRRSAWMPRTGAVWSAARRVAEPRRQAAKVHCNKRPFAEKESCRWLDATIASAALLAAGALAVTVVGDREGDIYEDFALRPPEVDVLYRAHHDRVLADGTSCSASPPAGRN